MKYTKELLEPIVAASVSYADVLRFLGVKQAGGTQSHIKTRIIQLGLDTSHFTGQAHNKDRVAGNKKSPKEILIILPKDSLRPKGYQLVRAMKESGIKYSCNVCSNIGIWNELPLVLEIDHINNNWLDNRLHNLQFLCPNCHAQKTKGL